MNANTNAERLNLNFLRMVFIIRSKGLFLQRAILPEAVYGHRYADINTYDRSPNVFSICSNCHLDFKSYYTVISTNSSHRQ